MTFTAKAVEPVRLTVYGRTYCHLCEEMVDALREMQGKFEFDIEMIDVDQDPALEARFGELVPVLMHGDVRICHYHLDRDRLTAHLISFR